MKKDNVHDKEKRKERWDTFLDIVFFVPELIFVPIKWLFRGILSVFKHWN